MIEMVLLSLITGCLLAGQFVRIELLNKMVNGYGQEFFILFFILYSIFKHGSTPIKKFLKNKNITGVLVLFFLSFIWTFSRYTFVQNGIAFLFPLRLLLYVSFGIYLLNYIHTHKGSKSFIESLIYTFSILLLIGSAVQYIFFTNLWGLYTAGWDPHEYRIYFTYLDVYVAAALFGMLCLYWMKKRNWKLSALFLLGLVLTFSRSAYAAFLLVAFFSLFLNKKWREGLLIIFIFAILVLFVPKPFGEGVNLLRTSSINSRIKDYKVGLLLWKTQPLLGHGYNRIHFVKEKMNLIKIDDTSHATSSFHSSFLIILATGGVVGLGAFLLLMFHLLRRFPESRTILLYILFMSLFDNVILHVLVLLPLIILITGQKKEKLSRLSSK